MPCLYTGERRPSVSSVFSVVIRFNRAFAPDYYLPRLAQGVDIPCFALTSPSAGSDAGAIPDVGIVRMSTAFALTTDLVLLVLGGAFKFREKISGRLADVLSHLYMSCAAG